MTYDLNLHIWRLLIKEPFFAALSRQIPKRQDRSIPTAAVALAPDGKINLLYNPEFMDSLSDVQARGVLKHEFYHVIYNHLTTRLPDDYDQKVWNYATDLAINSHLKGELPSGCLFPGQPGTLWEFLDWGKPSEYYWEALKGKIKPQPGDDGEPGGDQQGDGEGGNPEWGDQQGDGNCSGRGSHKKWGEGGEQTEKLARERMKGIFEQAVKEASEQTNGWGTVPIEARQIVTDFLKTQIDWRKVLSFFIKASQRAERYSSIRRINRRYPYIHAGKRVRRRAKIAVCIDQSGSVDDEMLGLFFAELNKLAKIAEFTVVPFDDEVFEDKIYVWKKDEQRKRERVLCGGTDFDAPTKWVNENKFDACMILTDMYAPKPKPCKVPRLWVTTEDCMSNPYFVTNERIIAVKR